METGMKRILSTGLCLLALALPAAAAGFAGKYKVTGTDMTGKPYAGDARIVLYSDTTCKITWVTGPQTWEGNCMRVDDVFAASFKMGKIVGMAIYKVQGDNSMQGYWTIRGQNGSGTETLTPVN